MKRCFQCPGRKIRFMNFETLGVIVIFMGTVIGAFSSRRRY